MESLQSFIKDETGFKNDIHTEKDWRVLVGKMAKGDPHLGVLQGYELAWARKDNPRLKPLAIAVNKNFLPQDDESQFQVTARAPEGASLQTTQTIMESIAARVRKLPEVETTVGKNRGAR